MYGKTAPTRVSKTRVSNVKYIYRSKCCRPGAGEADIILWNQKVFFISAYFMYIICQLRELFIVVEFEYYYFSDWSAKHIQQINQDVPTIRISRKKIHTKFKLLFFIFLKVFIYRAGVGAAVDAAEISNKCEAGAEFKYFCAPVYFTVYCTVW